MKSGICLSPWFIWLAYFTYPNVLHVYLCCHKCQDFFFPFYDWITSCWAYHSFFIQLSTEGHVSGLHVLATVYYAMVNTAMQILFMRLISFLQIYTQKEGSGTESWIDVCRIFNLVCTLQRIRQDSWHMLVLWKSASMLWKVDSKLTREKNLGATSVSQGRGITGILGGMIWGCIRVYFPFLSP